MTEAAENTGDGTMRSESDLRRYATVEELLREKLSEAIGGWRGAAESAVPTLVFALCYFRPRLWAASLLLAPVLVLYAPWLIRNYFVTGNPAGVAFYSLFDHVGLSDAGHMRQMKLEFAGMSLGAWRNKLTGNLSDQLGRIFQLFGWSVAALLLPARKR